MLEPIKMFSGLQRSAMFWASDPESGSELQVSMNDVLRVHVAHTSHKDAIVTVELTLRSLHKTCGLRPPAVGGRCTWPQLR